MNFFSIFLFTLIDRSDMNQFTRIIIIHQIFFCSIFAFSTLNQSIQLLVDLSRNCTARMFSCLKQLIVFSRFSFDHFLEEFEPKYEDYLRMKINSLVRSFDERSDLPLKNSSNLNEDDEVKLSVERQTSDGFRRSLSMSRR